MIGSQMVTFRDHANALYVVVGAPIRRYLGTSLASHAGS